MIMVNKILVIGTGQMGSGIIQVLLTGGYQVNAYDVYKPAVDSLKGRLEKAYGKMVEKGKATNEDTAKWLSGLSLCPDIDKPACAVDLVIEAATENAELKLELFKKLDELCPAETVLASNTSSISITKIASATKRPEKVIGMHFFNPVPVMKLLELIPGLKTAPSTCEVAAEVGEKLGKAVANIQKDAPGFVVNRILIPMINEAALLFEEGVASAEVIDKAMLNGASHPIGPLALSDLIGNDTVLAIMQVLYDEFQDTKYRPALIFKRMVSAGKLGRKSGEGFFKYN